MAAQPRQPAECSHRPGSALLHSKSEQRWQLPAPLPDPEAFLSSLGPDLARQLPLELAVILHRRGHGTAAAIEAAGLPVRTVNKVKDGRPHIADQVKAGEIQLVFTTVDETRTAIADSRHIRQAALANRITYYTTMAGCEAATEALKHRSDIEVFSLQELHGRLPAGMATTH